MLKYGIHCGAWSRIEQQTIKGLNTTSVKQFKQVKQRSYLYIKTKNENTYVPYQQTTTSEQALDLGQVHTNAAGNVDIHVSFFYAPPPYDSRRALCFVVCASFRSSVRMARFRLNFWSRQCLMKQKSNQLENTNTCSL